METQADPTSGSIWDKAYNRATSGVVHAVQYAVCPKRKTTRVEGKHDKSLRALEQ
jgi:hypothetical protein